jgi:hypothetical protein
MSKEISYVVKFICNEFNLSKKDVFSRLTKHLNIEPRKKTLEVKNFEPVSDISVELNKSFTHTLSNAYFDSLPIECVDTIFKDGRVFSHFIEHWLEQKYPLKRVSGCKEYDHIDVNFPNTKYEQKTFTSKGCDFTPSSMKGTKRIFDKELFEEKALGLVYCIVSNVNFPEIKVRYVTGAELISKFPRGKINIKLHDEFFS